MLVHHPCTLITLATSLSASLTAPRGTGAGLAWSVLLSIRELQKYRTHDTARFEYEEGRSARLALRRRDHVGSRPFVLCGTRPCSRPLARHPERGGPGAHPAVS